MTMKTKKSRKEKKAPRPITAQPIGDLYAADATMSRSERRSSQHDTPQVATGCYRRMPHLFD